MLRRVIAAGVVGLVVAGTVTVPGATASASPDDHRRLRQLIERIATEDGAPGAMARVEERDGRTTMIRSGVGDIETGAPIPVDGHWRIGSMTKPYVATVVLQLVGEGDVELDAPVDRYLPGLVDRKITVRHILQHTSGLPDYLKHLSMPDIIANPLAHHDRSDLLATALKHPPLFKPGKEWSYGNTGYLLAGMLIEKVTGRPYGDEIKRRILKPLGLSHTYVPVDDSFLPSPHPRGYVRTAPDAAPLDRTRLNPSVAPSSGNMVSTASDVNRFFSALLGGRLLDRPELREMKTTRPTGRESGSRYGLGLERVKLPCGGHLWGHAGDFIGFSTRSGINADGRTVTIMANLKPGNTDAQDDDLADALTTALCD
ncbi:serine hydrolase domain-containing protein [Actinomadura sp. 1N219]|uniref:serine hydrolase domain-containing protein n=1 Tax=Actinomadura sp. 1N219 TaxID=3375152 RepID=UPI00379640DF